MSIPAPDPKLPTPAPAGTFAQRLSRAAPAGGSTGAGALAGFLDRLTQSMAPDTAATTPTTVTLASPALNPAATPSHGTASLQLTAAQLAPSVQAIQTNVAQPAVGAPTAAPTSLVKAAPSNSRTDLTAAPLGPDQSQTALPPSPPPTQSQVLAGPNPATTPQANPPKPATSALTRSRAASASEAAAMPAAAPTSLASSLGLTQNVPPASVPPSTQPFEAVTPRPDAASPAQISPAALASDASPAKITVTATPAATSAIIPITAPPSAPELPANPTVTLDIASTRQIEPAILSLPAHIAQPASTTTSAAPPPPATQIANAFLEPVKVALATPAHQNAGPQVLSIKLDPEELGKVEVRIERSSDGPARIDIVAARPETLQRLVHDQPQLQQMLDQAGIPAAGRTVHFSLGTDTAANSSGSGFTAGNDAGTGQPGSGFQRSHQSYPGATASDSDLVDQASPAARSTRAGLDITA